MSLQELAQYEWVLWIMLFVGGWAGFWWAINRSYRVDDGPRSARPSERSATFSEREPPFP